MTHYSNISVKFLQLEKRLRHILRAVTQESISNPSVQNPTLKIITQV